MTRKRLRKIEIKSKCPHCGQMVKKKTRTNYPFGKKSKPFTTVVCPYCHKVW